MNVSNETSKGTKSVQQKKNKKRVDGIKKIISAN